MIAAPGLLDDDFGLLGEPCASLELERLSTSESLERLSESESLGGFSSSSEMVLEELDPESRVACSGTGVGVGVAQ